ncbi:MAG: hypothetical protein AAF591_04040 [Verrucomicrobiota bacterium]
MKTKTEELRVGSQNASIYGGGPRRNQRGAALIMTMVVLVMMSILVTGFLVSMRTEMVAAHSVEDIQRTKMVAQGAVGHAVNLLRANIPGPAPIQDTISSAEVDHWVVNPGLLTVLENSGGPREVELHTGVPTTNPKTDEVFQGKAVDLNRPLPGDVIQGKPVPPITYALDSEGMPDSSVDRPEMWVNWVNVLKDPAEAVGEENPIIGRYGFWIDDECARLNYNVASGKPSYDDDAHNGRNFHEMLDMGMVTPGLRMGSEATKYNESENAGNNLRMWSLGSPRSTNLDVLFENKNQLLRDDLLDDTWVRGFNRYPEGILEYINMDGNPDEIEEETKWFREQRFNLTFYSRSPEFSPFGRSRLFTSRIPLSLEAGPLYQLPFVVAPVNAREPWRNNLHMHTLMGTFGFTDSIDEDGDGRNDFMAGNLVNSGQLQMLMDYLRRDDWPGYEGQSFVDKYGEKECYQIALNMLAMARNWTAGYNQNDMRAWSQGWYYRTSSVLYHPPGDERRGENPERFYWRFGDSDGAFPDQPGGNGHRQSNGETLMFPQTPGPHVSEVRLVFDTEWNETMDDNNPRYLIKVRAEAELYAHPFCPPVAVWRYPVAVDYLYMELEGLTDDYVFEFGRPSPKDGGPESTQESNQRNWNVGRSLGMLKVFARKADGDGTGSNGDDLLFPVNGRLANASEWSDNPEEFEVAEIRGVDRYIGAHPADDRLYNKIFANNGGDTNRPWRRVGFDPSVNPDLKITALKVRFGMAHGNDTDVTTNNPGGVGISGRPRQMIPLGEYADDTLDLVLGGGDGEDSAQLTLSDPDVGSPVSVSWEINDPLLSWDKNQWKRTVDESGERAGSPAAVNSGSGSGSSKFRYIPRGPNRFQVRKPGGRWHLFRRSDEYNSYTATASKGYWSLIRTGIQSSSPFKTMDLTADGQRDSLPDSLLLEIMGSIYPMQHDQWKIEATLPDQFSTVSYMNSTAGAINLNSRIFPDDNPYFEASKFERRKPLEAVFKELRDDSDVEKLVNGIIDHQTGNNRFLYIGDIAKADGYDAGATNQWEEESILRNMAGALTTQSNTFGLWGVAQTVQKSPQNGKYDEFEAGDQVVGEKRFFAVIERYVWPGKDGVPGNAHASSSGKFDRVAKQERKITVESGGWRLDNEGDDTTATFSQLPGSPPQKRTGNQQTGNGIVLDKNGIYPEYDGPQAVGMDSATKTAIGDVKYTRSTLEEAYNPPQPVIKYRVAYFKYLDQ